MSLSFTPLMKRRLTHRALAMIERSLCCFPELKDKAIIVGYTRRHLGSATLRFRAKAAEPQLIMRLKVRKLTYQTIGHELTHLVQGLAHHQGRRNRKSRGKIPSGEKACDIWTLARHDLFCDDAPTYLRLPRAVRDNWSFYSAIVRRLCVTAIEKRPHHRTYIRWLESEFRQLTRQLPENRSGEQLALPLVAF